MQMKCMDVVEAENTFRLPLYIASRFLNNLSAYYVSLVWLPVTENVDGGTMIVYLHVKIHVLSVWNSSAQWPQKVCFS